MENVVVVVEEEEQYEGHVRAWRTLLKLILFLAPELEMVRRFSETLVQASSVAIAQLRQILEELVQASSCMLLTSEEVFGRIDCTSFKPTSSEAVSSSPLDYTL